MSLVDLMVGDDEGTRTRTNGIKKRGKKKIKKEESGEKACWRNIVRQRTIDSSIDSYFLVVSNKSK